MRRILFIISVASALAVAAVIIGLHTRPSMHQWQSRLATEEDFRQRDNALQITWLGTASVLISDGRTSVLSDGFFSRPGMVSLATGPVAPDQAQIDSALQRHDISSLDAVLVLHSHYDHAMDAPVVARKTGARLLGSESTANVGRGLGLPETQIQVVTDGEPIMVGDFRITFLRSGHVPQNRIIDLATGMNEQISEPLSPPAWISDYKEGESWAVLLEHPTATVLLQGSAGYREGQLDGFSADLALVSSVGLFRQPDAYQAAYYANTVGATGASTVVPIHWDDFFVPLAGEDTPPLPWLAEHLNGSFEALALPAQAQGKRFMLVLPEQTFWFAADQATSTAAEN